RMFQRAATIEPTAAVLYELAMGHLRREDWQSALEQFERVLSQHADHAEALFGKANALRALQQPQAALAAYQPAAQLCPDNPKFHNFLGVALIGQQQHSQAEAALRRAVQLAPHYTAAWNNLG